MTQATHMLDWDVMLPINGTPVIFSEFSLECAIEQGSSGPYVQALKLYFDNGMYRKTGEVEHKVVLDIPSDHATEKALKEPFENGDWNRCFDILFGFMVSQQLQKNELLIEELS